MEFSGGCVLIHLFNKHFLNPFCVPVGISSSKDAMVCIEEIMVEKAAKVPTVMAAGPRNMTKDICLGGNRALETGLKKFSMVMCTVMLEN